MKRLMFLIPVVALFVGTFLPSTSFAACLFNCSMGSTTLNPDWDLSQSGRLEIHFDEGAKCRQVRDAGADINCPDEFLSAKPSALCDGAGCACPAEGTPGSGACPSNGDRKVNTYTLATAGVDTMDAMDDKFVFGQFFDKVQGKDTLIANGCFQFKVQHKGDMLYVRPIADADAWEIVQFAKSDSTTQMEGFVKRTLTSGKDVCGSDDQVPGCPPGDGFCEQLLGGEALMANKVATAFPQTDDLEPGQTLLALQDPNAGSVILSRPCAGKQGEDESSIECIESGKPHDATMDADLVAECLGDWYPAQVNSNGTNPHKYAIADAGNCVPSEIDPTTVTVNGAPVFGCGLEDAGGGPLMDLVCSVIEADVAAGTPVGTPTCNYLNPGDDGNIIYVNASGVIRLGGDDVPLTASDQVVCKVN